MVLLRPKPTAPQGSFAVTGAAHEKILITLWGGATDFFKSLPAMAAVQAAYPQSAVYLFVPPALVDMAKRSRLFADVLTCRAKGFFDFAGHRACYQTLKNIAPDAVCDLGVSLPFAARKALAGVLPLRIDVPEEVPLPALHWMQTDVSLFGLQKPYVLLLPGDGGQGWPAVRYAAAALRLDRDGYDVAVLGTDFDAAMAAKIRRAAPAVKDLCGRTSYYDVYSLAQSAAGMIGRSSAALHLAAAAGCPLVVLLDGHADVKAETPRGHAVTVIQADDMAEITVEEVIKNLRPRRKTGDAA